MGESSLEGDVQSHVSLEMIGSEQLKARLLPLLEGLNPHTSQYLGPVCTIGRAQRSHSTAASLFYRLDAKNMCGCRQRCCYKFTIVFY